MYISREEKNGITQKLLKELFAYKDGKLYWKRKVSPKSSKIKIGGIAGYLRKEDSSGGGGYRIVVINKNKFYEHRVIFLWHHGYCPKYIDHKDRIRDHNIINNLRESTCSENAVNREISIHNKTGTKGLTISTRNNKRPWHCQIRRGGNQILNKYFSSKKEAVEAINDSITKYNKENEH